MTAGRTHIIADFKIRQKKIRQISKTLSLISFTNTSQNEKLTYLENFSLSKVLFSDNPIEKNFNIPFIMIYEKHPSILNIIL